MKALLIFAGVLVTSVGCVSHDPIDLDKVRVTLEVDVSTKGQTKELLGIPTATYEDGSQLLYTIDKGIVLFVPHLIGLDVFSIESRSFLFLEFDDNGVLRSLDIEETDFAYAGPTKTKVPLAAAFVTEAENILNAYVVSWVLEEKGCNTLEFWDRWGFANVRDTRLALAIGSDFVGFAEWQDDKRYDVKWMAENVDLVSVSADSFGLNKCVVLAAKNLPTVTFSIPSESIWLNTDRKRVDSALGDLLARLPSL